MKKIGHSIFILLLIGLCAYGCMDKCKTEILEYYITDYSVSRDISLFSNKNDKNLYEIRILGGEIVSYSSKGEKLETFKELARKNGDTSYKEVIECANLSPMPVRCFFSVPISRINITCDKDVDEMHPAGSSLNDLFLFLTFSPDKYLKNGYKPLNIDKEKESEKVDKRFRHTVNAIFNFGTSSELVYGTLSEINFSHYKLLGIAGYPSLTCAEFSWITPPVNLTKYTLQVEIEFADGVKKNADLTV